jgi:hypothetical protein
VRPRVVSARSIAELGRRQINGLVRDYPELVELLSREGIDPTERGGQRLFEVLSRQADAARVSAQVLAALRWRNEAPQRGAVSLPASERPATY